VIMPQAWLVVKMGLIYRDRAFSGLRNQGETSFLFTLFLKSLKTCTIPPVFRTLVRKAMSYNWTEINMLQDSHILRLTRIEEIEINFILGFPGLLD
jgi:hypothetical protein